MYFGKDTNKKSKIEYKFTFKVESINYAQSVLKKCYLLHLSFLKSHSISSRYLKWMISFRR